MVEDQPGGTRAIAVPAQGWRGAALGGNVGYHLFDGLEVEVYGTLRQCFEEQSDGTTNARTVVAFVGPEKAGFNEGVGVVFANLNRRDE